MRYSRSILFFVLMVFASFVHAQTQARADTLQQKSISELDFKVLFDSKQYFKLRDLYEKHGAGLPKEQRLFYRALLDNIFNRSGQSNEVIAELFAPGSAHLGDSVIKQLLIVQADNYIKLYQYKLAADTYLRLISSFKKITDAEEMADLRNSQSLWSAIANVPPQEVEINLTSTVMCKRDKIGLIQVPIMHGDDTTDMIFDTGANLSVITKTAAKKLGMKIFPVNIDLASGTTGHTVKSSLAVADSLFLGEILIRNAVFLLLPDEMLNFKQQDYRQDGIIGEPIIAQLKEVTIRKDGTLTVSHQPGFHTQNNLALDGLMPIAELTTLQDSLPFRFDTGASSSVLYKPFFDRFRSYVLRNGVANKLRTGGVGGKIVETDAYTLTNFTLGIDRHLATMSRISVRSTSLNSQGDMFFGNLGQDLLRSFSSLRINFDTMFVDVE